MSGNIDVSREAVETLLPYASPRMREMVCALLDRAEKAEHKAKVMSEIADGKQATIDRLMLEYCSDEMTPEQLDEWGRKQVKARAGTHDREQAERDQPPRGAAR